MFISVTSAERADALIDRIGPMLTDFRIVMDISDVQVIRGDRF